MSSRAHGKVAGLKLRGVACLLVFLALLFAIAPNLGSARAENAAAPKAVSLEEAAAPELAPTTTADPGVALDDLDIMLEPLTRAEVETEAKGWFALLRAKVSEISLAELAVRRKNREIEQLAKEKAAGEVLAKAAQEANAKQTSADATAAEKAEAAERLAAAQKDLAETLDSAQQQAVSDQKQAATAANVASAKNAEAAKVSSAMSENAAKIGGATDVVAAAVEQKAVEPESAPNVSASMAKEASAADAAKSLAATTSDAAIASDAASGTGTSADQTSSKAEQLSTKATEATGAKTEVKVALVDLSTQLTSERTALADRLKLVLDKWELKGGDPAEYRQYISALSGFKIDVSDQTATWERTKAWLAAEEGGLRWTRNLGIFLCYVIGSVIVAWIVRKILRRVMSATNVSSNLLRDFVVSMSGRAIVFFGVLLGLSALEFNLSPILAAVGAAGFVVAFALQGTLSNFASGLLIMVNKPFDVGDIVEIGSDIKGKVKSVTIFSTMIEKDDGLTMIVPNNTVWSGVITNHSAPASSDTITTA
jgi:small conductance mechanosensitive channel